MLISTFVMHLFSFVIDATVDNEGLYPPIFDVPLDETGHCFFKYTQTRRLVRMG